MSERRTRVELVLASFLMLFVELALIRWLGANVLYLSYFSNFVLLGSFLGIGLGFLRAERSPGAFRWTPVLLAALVAFVELSPVEIDRSGGDAIFFGGTTTGLPAWLTLPVVFAAVAAVLAAIADGVAVRFARFEALEAYRLDIGGSILGILGFSLLSWLQLPPVVWGVVAAVVIAVLLGVERTLARGAALALLVAMLAIESSADRTVWSPYYEISYEERVGVLEGSTGESVSDIGVWVNGIPHQRITSVEDRLATEPYYQRPHEVVDEPADEMLIIGAGTGTDVAIALDAGVGHIDAVEIDPALAELGRTHNPDRPYDDPRVDLHVDDGRAWLERTDQTYDQILLALPDSLVLVAGQSALRLESYLFTTQALEAARERLAPDGVFSMYNFYREPWLVERYATTLEEAFGHPPCVELPEGNGTFATLSIGRTPDAARCDPWTIPDGSPGAVTDDSPFPYLREPGIPPIYLFTVTSVLLVSLLAVRVVGGPVRTMVPFADLFCMGAAFLLLETKYVVQFALLFGTTWIVNAIVFGGVLVSVYLAVELAKRVSLPRPALLYALLLAGIVLAAVVPLDALLELDVLPRLVVATGLAFVPIFVANLVFAQRFAETGSSSRGAFGANLLGAMFGGLLEYLALLTGYRALLVVVALLYGAAFLAGRRHLAPAAG